MTSPIDLPLSITSELIKSSLDGDVILSKNTKIAFSRIGGVFILYISHLANEICKSKGRSKIVVTDVYEALAKAGFEDFNPIIEKTISDYEGNMNVPAKNKEKEKEKEEGVKNVVLEAKNN